MSGGPTVSQTSSRGGSTARTTQTRAHRTSDPDRLRPRNRTPGAAAPAPSSHSAPAALVAPRTDARHVGQHGPHRLRRRVDDDLDRAGLRQPPLRAVIAGWVRFRPHLAALRNQLAITAVWPASLRPHDAVSIVVPAHRAAARRR